MIFGGLYCTSFQLLYSSMNDSHGDNKNSIQGENEQNEPIELSENFETIRNECDSLLTTSSSTDSLAENAKDVPSRSSLHDLKKKETMKFPDQVS